MSHGKFVRSFSLPADSDTDKIKAGFQNGVLTIEIPKPEHHKPKQITVN
jgi:HSP20 family protein